MAFNTIVFDLGGVLIDWNPRYLYRKLLPEAEMEWFLTNVCTQSWNELQDGGRPIAEGIALACREHPKYSELIQAFYGRWEEMLAGPIHESVKILEDLCAHEDYRLYALSNWSRETFPIAEKRFDFLRIFHGKIISGQENLKKPDPKIFQLLQYRYQIDADRAVFIDDVERNVRAGEHAGFTGIHFTHAEALRSHLKKLKIL